jgi:hypothetical protein
MWNYTQFNLFYASCIETLISIDILKKQEVFKFAHFVLCDTFYQIYTSKYMYACRNLRLTDKTIIFSEHEVFKVVVMVTR